MRIKNIKTIMALLFLSTTLLLFQNCGGSSGADSGNTTLASKANFEYINDYILQPKCARCHGLEFEFGGLNVMSYIGVMKAVVPGDPESSGLYTRGFTTNTFSMTDEEYAIIKAWIEDGALLD